eukprot:PRCOL_00000006-RA
MRASWVLAALAALALAGNQRQGPRWTGIPSLVSAAAQSPDINSNLNLGTNATNSSDAPDEVPEISFSVEGAPGSGVVATCGICRFFTDEVGTLQREPPTGDCGFALGVPSIPPCGALDMHGGEGLMTGLAEGIFDGMAALRVMDLGSHPISELPAGVFDSLSELRQLEMHFFALTSLPVDIFKNNTKLEFLGLRENSLTTLPVGIFSNLTKLAFLSLRANGMSLVPAGLFNGLSALEELDLVSNLFDRLPVDIFQNLTSLRVLRMPNNGLQVLDPNTFAGLDKLEHLDIRSNQIGDLTPSLLDGLPSLRILQVGSNPLGPTLPGALFANATNLEALYMPDAELESLPNTIFQPLTSLRVLDLSVQAPGFCVPPLPPQFPQELSQVDFQALIAGLYPHDPHDETHPEYAYAVAGGAVDAVKGPDEGAYVCSCQCEGIGASGTAFVGEYKTPEQSGLTCFCAEPCLQLCADISLTFAGLQCEITSP